MELSPFGHNEVLYDKRNRGERGSWRSITLLDVVPPTQLDWVKQSILNVIQTEGGQPLFPLSP